MVLERVRVVVERCGAWLASHTARIRERWTSAQFRKHLFAALLLGFAIRLILIPLTSESDLVNNAEPALTMAYGGGPYTFLSVYPPLWPALLNLDIHVTGAVYPLQDVLRTSPLLLGLNAQVGYVQPAYLAAPAFLLAEKAPIVVFDLLTGLLLYRIADEMAGSRELAARVFVLWWLSPLVLVESSVHGAYDVLPAFFAIAATYLTAHGRNLGAGLALGGGIFLKVFPVFLVPLLAIAIFRRADRAWRRALFGIGSLVAGIALVALLALAPGGVFQDYLVPQFTGSYPGGSTFGGFGVLGPLSWTFLHPASNWFSDHTSTITAILLYLAVAIALGVAWAFSRSRAPTLLSRPGLWAVVLTVSASFLPLPFLQPQYLLWVLPGLTLLFVVRGEARIAYWVLSIVPITVYLVALGGPLYFFETPALFWGRPSLGWLLAQLAPWRSVGPLLVDLFTIPTFLASILLWWQGTRRLARPTPGAT